VAFRSSLAIAVRALGRNRLQTSLTIVGMTIGVAAVLAMIAIGTGAEAARRAFSYRRSGGRAGSGRRVMGRA